MVDKTDATMETEVAATGDGTRKQSTQPLESESHLLEKVKRVVRFAY